MKRHSLTALSLFAVALLAACGGGKDAPSAQSAVAGAEALAANPLTRGVTALSGATIDSSLRRASGPVEVWVALDQNSLARTRAVLAATTGVQRVRALSSPSGEGAKRAEPASIATAMANQRRSILAQQAAMSLRLSSLGAPRLGGAQRHRHLDRRQPAAADRHPARRDERPSGQAL